MDNEMEKLIEAIKDLSNVVNTIKAEQLRRVDRPEVLYADREYKYRRNNV